MDLKATLHLAAISAIQHNVELKKYYERKVEEGKCKMSVINAVRNKLLARIVAVVHRGTPYVQLTISFYHRYRSLFTLSFGRYSTFAVKPFN